MRQGGYALVAIQAINDPDLQVKISIERKRLDGLQKSFPLEPGQSSSLNLLPIPAKEIAYFQYFVSSKLDFSAK